MEINKMELKGKKWHSVLADQLEGGVSEERALLDIKRGIMNNLYHESLGLFLSAKIKGVSLSQNITGVATIAIDRVRNLIWKDFREIAKGNDVVVPHTGNVDTYQTDIDSMSYSSYRFPVMDFARMKNSPTVRANLIASFTKTWASTVDAEYFELVIAAAAGQKDAVIEVDIPKQFKTLKATVDLYVFIADVVSEIEQKVNQYYIGINRREIMTIVGPYLYTRIIRGITGDQLAVSDKILGWIQNEQIEASKISGISIVRHPFIGIKVPKEASNNFGHYDFTGIHALICHTNSIWVQSVFQNGIAVPNSDTTYTITQAILWGKGVIYGDLLRVLKAPSTKEKPFGWETNLITFREIYNSRYGNKDWGIKIPDSIEKLRENYRQGVIKFN